MTLIKQYNQPLPEQEKLNWLRLSRTENVGPITFFKLVERFGSVSESLLALPELAKNGGRKNPLIAPDMAKIEKEYEQLRAMGGDIVTASCPSYPLALGVIPDAPPILSVFGDIKLANQSCIAMVGAHNASLNGRKMTEKLSR